MQATKQNGKKKDRKMAKKTINLSRDSYVIIKHGDLKFSISLHNSKSEYGTEYKYVLIHHDTTFKEVSFPFSLNAKVSSTHTNGRVYDVSINEPESPEESA